MPDPLSFGRADGVGPSRARPRGGRGGKAALALAALMLLAACGYKGPLYLPPPPDPDPSLTTPPSQDLSGASESPSATGRD